MVYRRSGHVQCCEYVHDLGANDCALFHASLQRWLPPGPSTLPSQPCQVFEHKISSLL
jgi:hypothetical protein